MPFEQLLALAMLAFVDFLRSGRTTLPYVLDIPPRFKGISGRTNM